MSLNPTVVVLKRHLLLVFSHAMSGLNPTVVVLKPYSGGAAQGDRTWSQSNRSGFETKRRGKALREEDASQSNRSGFETTQGRRKHGVHRLSQSNRSGFETVALDHHLDRKTRLNPTVVVLKLR